MHLLASGFSDTPILAMMASFSSIRRDLTDFPNAERLKTQPRCLLRLFWILGEDICRKPFGNIGISAGDGLAWTLFEGMLQRWHRGGLICLASGRMQALRGLR